MSEHQLRKVAVAVAQALNAEAPAPRPALPALQGVRLQPIMRPAILADATGQRPAVIAGWRLGFLINLDSRRGKTLETQLPAGIPPAELARALEEIADALRALEPPAISPPP